MRAVEVRVTGTVQGVGFRPTVWRLATQEALVGEVRNDGEGVLIRAGGAPEAIARFLARLGREAPPLSRVEQVCVRELAEPLDAAGDHRVQQSLHGERVAAVPMVLHVLAIAGEPAAVRVGDVVLPVGAHHLHVEAVEAEAIALGGVRRGEVVLGINTRPAYLEQGRTELDDDRTVLEEVAGDSDHVQLEDGPVHVRTFLRALQFDDATASTRIADLSGGERNRVQLARLLRRGGNLLVLDEPTNDLDLLTLGALE